MLDIDKLMNFSLTSENTISDDFKFIQLKDTIASQDLPHGEPLDWSDIKHRLNEIICLYPPNLLSACYFAYALARCSDEERIANSILYIRTFLERYWDTMSPPKIRIKVRTNMMSWYIDRLSILIPDQKNISSQIYQSIQTEVKKLSLLCREHFGSDIFDVDEIIQRIPHISEEKKHIANTDKSLLQDIVSKDTLSHPKSNFVTRESQVTSLSSTPQDIDKEQIHKTPREIGDDLCRLARSLSKENDSNPQAYRLWRIGLWINVIDTPISHQGRTKISSIPKSILHEIQDNIQKERYLSALQLSENSMLQNRLCLDLQYFSYIALNSMGDSYSSAKHAVEEQTQVLYRRIPDFIDQKFNDGTPIISDVTRSWITSYYEKQSQFKNVCYSSIPDQKSISSKSRRYQFFMSLLNESEKYLKNGHLSISYALYRKLDKIIRHHDIDKWDPTLALRSLHGFYRVMQSIPSTPNSIRASTFERIALLSPKSAIAIKPNELGV